MTPVFLGGFYNFSTSGNRNRHHRIVIIKFTLTVFSIAALVSAVRGNCGWRSRQSVPSNRLCATFAESRPMFVFSTLVSKFFNESSSRKYFKFPHVLTKIVSK